MAVSEVPSSRSQKPRTLAVRKNGRPELKPSSSMATSRGSESVRRIPRLAGAAGLGAASGAAVIGLLAAPGSAKSGDELVFLGLRRPDPMGPHLPSIAFSAPASSGLVRKSSMPTAMQALRSSSKASAVRATMAPR